LKPRKRRWNPKIFRFFDDEMENNRIFVPILHNAFFLCLFFQPEQFTTSPSVSQHFQTSTRTWTY
jgi:hypothetical protein